MKQHTGRPQHERGALPIGIIIGVAIVGALIFVGIQLIPIYWNHLNFQDEAAGSVKLVFVRYQRNQEKQLRGEIVGALKEMNAIYEDKNIKIKVDEKKKFARVEVWYALAHKVPFLENPMQFYVTAESTGGM